MANKTLPPHLEELIVLLEAQDPAALDRAGAIREARRRHPAERITWKEALELDAFRERWEDLQELRTLALQDKAVAGGLSGARSAATLLRAGGGLGEVAPNNGKPTLTRAHRKRVEAASKGW